MELILRKNQISHCENIWNTLLSNNFFVDTSVMGSGKTYTSSYFLKKAIEYFWLSHCLVICPLGIMANWRRMANIYGLPIVCVSYESLRSTRGKQPSHGLLHRYDNEDGSISFAPTKEYKEFVKRGLLIIADEFHHVKNQSAQRAALQALLTVIGNKSPDLYSADGTRIQTGSDNNSRVMLLSGTPFDKEEQVMNLFQTLGVIEMVKYDKKKNFHVSAVTKLIALCSKYNARETKAVTSQYIHYETVYSSMQDFCYQLWIKILKKHTVFSMPSPEIDANLICYNTYFQVDAKTGRRLTKAINRLSSAARYNSRTGSIEKGERNFAGIGLALEDIEKQKIGIFVRRAKRDLIMDPTCKVVLLLNYLKSIDRCALELEKYKPLILTGSVKEKDREKFRIMFQAHTTERRLLIANLKVSSEGIDLDDTHGDFKRYVYVSPNYNIQTIHQMTHRFHRADTKSDTEIRMVYADIKTSENSILNALSRKNEVMMANLERQVKEGVIFPANYPREDEFYKLKPEDYLDGFSTPEEFDEEDDSEDMLPVIEAVKAVRLGGAPDPRKNLLSEFNFAFNKKK